MARVHSDIYFFGGGVAEGRSAMRDLLGGKGANLAEMASLKLPVPPGFTISTRVCNYFYEHKQKYPPGLAAGVAKSIARTEKILGRKFGASKNPLLVSVRSGARVSMPGMMDTVLNLGLTDETVHGLAQASDNPRFAWDSYRRFCQMYGDVVLKLKPESATEHDPFEVLIEQKKKARGVEQDVDLSAEDLQELVGEFRELIRRRVGRDVPQNPEEQLWEAIGAVFGSWNNDRAIAYRRINDIPGDWGTAVTVQAMVFGNLGPDCATGVAFTRDPATGEKGIYGEFLPNAQGEDVVAGIRTPRQISLRAGRAWAERNHVDEAERHTRYATLEESFPGAYRDLLAIAKRLEHHFRDMQDLEFTIEGGRLFMLQTRNGKRTAEAAVKIAVDMTSERLIDRRVALMRVEPVQLEQLLHPRLDPKARKEVLARGLPASPGAVSGEIVFSAEEAVTEVNQGKHVVLVRNETSPEDINGMQVAEGILTARGGMTSHAAVVARGMGKCCVAGCAAIAIDYGAGTLSANGHVLRRGDAVTLDGSTGEVIAGEVPTVLPEMSAAFKKFMSWADTERRLGVRANADTPHDAEVALGFGAEGIGLCRTEHMFFDPQRIAAVREMILAETAEQRARALAKIVPFQREDFAGILKAMAGLPVTIRLLDPPLHEFLPKEDAEIAELARTMDLDPEHLRSVRDKLVEFNPMLGHRGARLGVSYPEIYRAQVRAILEAAAGLRAQGIKAMPEIMLPLIGDRREFELLANEIRAVAHEVLGGRNGARVPFTIGTMIEVPRACIVADQIGAVADFFSFGTNDLTQMTYGLSRDDSSKFVGDYLRTGIYRKDPFQELDAEGVGGLMRIAIQLGRKANPKIKLGICGEHGGDPASVKLCHGLGLDYVSCSPFRLPLARLAAAQAAIESRRAKGKAAFKDV
ncbi:MAG TPA: pyruvate, phosphate dikinase [Candidatus Binataceae bacterium]|nr:pyruvate, phosphate dikinase [Candidatus Binataceae bacterium]